ncbi:uncharacterized protein LOC127873362 isoform X2 [Dreissena polymorpha]|uniref:uncharacterized protein LOC127873362 isoform X2 n=1 Tax=Dreissena polymorpha TaxID=45954 RepID=UPI00226499CA|nr:uncharacterized protein LOC127873362 isoform X2 [Dreissena polymorpha]
MLSHHCPLLSAQTCVFMSSFAVPKTKVLLGAAIIFMMFIQTSMDIPLGQQSQHDVRQVEAKQTLFNGLIAVECVYLGTGTATFYEVHSNGPMKIGWGDNENCAVEDNIQEHELICQHSSQGTRAVLTIPNKNLIGKFLCQWNDGHSVIMSDDVNTGTCSAGTYRIVDDTGCTDCDLGYYQPLQFQTSCVKCPDGTSTMQTKSTLATDCKAYCPNGKEMVNDVCQDCSRGYYRSQSDGLFAMCLMCPLDKITPSTGATSISQCIIGNCSAGYWLKPDNTCEICPKGSYSESKWLTTCTPCGIHKTTKREGATNQFLCIVQESDSWREAFFVGAGVCLGVQLIIVGIIYFLAVKYEPANKLIIGVLDRLRLLLANGTNEELASPAPLPSFITSPGNLPSMIAGSPPPTTPTNVPQSVNVTMTTTGAGLTHSPGSPVPVDGQATSSSQGLQYSASFQKVTAPGRAAYTNLHGNAVSKSDERLPGVDGNPVEESDQGVCDEELPCVKMDKETGGENSGHGENEPLLQLETVSIKSKESAKPNLIFSKMGGIYPNRSGGCNQERCALVHS